MIDYVYSESTVRPSEMEISKTTVWLRKDITEELRTTDDGNQILFYVYKEAKLPPEGFNKIMKEGVNI